MLKKKDDLAAKIKELTKRVELLERGQLPAKVKDNEKKEEK